MSAVGPAPERPHPVISLGPVLQEAGVGGVTLVADGGVEHVYAERVATSATTVGDAAETLGRVAALARTTPGVAEVLARLPVSGVPTLHAAHPDWHLDHPRTGELLLVAASGHQFVDPFNPGEANLHGNHGGPEDLAVPLVVTGGWTGLRAAPRGTPPPGAVDVAPTITALLGLRAPRLLDGHPVPPGRAGHPIAAVLGDRPETLSRVGMDSERVTRFTGLTACRGPEKAAGETFPGARARVGATRAHPGARGR